MKKKKTQKKSRTKLKIIASSTFVLLVSVIIYQFLSTSNDNDAANTRSLDDDDDVIKPDNDVTTGDIGNDDVTKDDIGNGDDVIMDEEMLALFKSFDINRDDVIDLHEFPSVFLQIEELQQGKERGRQTSYHDVSNNDVITDDDAPHMMEYDEMVELSAEMEKFDVSTMKYAAKNNGNLSNLREFRGLLSWRTVAETNKELAAGRFAAFLPRHRHHQTLSTPYWLFTAPSPPDVTSQHHFRPPASWNDDHTVALVSSILSMFHPRPFVHMRFAPRGGAAVVSARNEQYLKIIFRLHCEFQLNEEGETPFWFTPGQLNGELIITKDGSHVHYFNLHVPNHRKLNVDMEWWVGRQEDDDVTLADDVTEDMEVDIGYLPLMKVESRTPSSPNELIDEDGSVIDRRKLREMGEDVELHFDDVIFDDDIGDEKALKLLDKFFNPFKKVDYLDFGAALEQCSSKRKLLHHVILWGALDDQSC